MIGVTDRPAGLDGWQFWIDRGGTFTDVIAVSPNGGVETLKLLSDAHGQYRDAAVEGVRRLFESRAGPGDRIAAVRIGTTAGTNALLERRGSPTVLVTTAGFGDLLRIGTQQRPALFELDIRLPEPLYSEVIEARERIAADGAVIEPLDESELRASLSAARERGIESVAIALLHGYRHIAHEQRAAEIAAVAGFSDISVSHEVSPRAKLVERGRTTVVDAYLSPVVRRYAAQLAEGLDRRNPDIALSFMQSNGGLTDAAGFRGHNCILSGPAGGVVGMADTASRAGYRSVIGFDMGGTSTDVSVYADGFERADTTEVAGVSLAIPTVRIHTVASGGGSKLSFRDGRLTVGPESAGAAPGPACYGAGGPATLTDANVYLGRIQPDYFPRVFGPDGRQPVAADLARNAIESLAAASGGGSTLTPDQVAAGSISIAVNHMAAAIEKISVQRGHDPRHFALACFGGAGGQHACLVAESLGIDCVLIDPLAGVLSAYGIGIADRRALRSAAIEAPLDEPAVARAADAARRLATEAAGPAQAGTDNRSETRVRLRAGTSETVLAVPFPPGSSADSLRAAFVQAYRKSFGFDPHTAEVRLDAVEVEAIVTLPRPERPRLASSTEAPAPQAMRRAWIAGAWQETPVYERDRLGPGTTIEGPAIIVEANGTTVVESHWRARIDAIGTLILTRSPAAADVGTGNGERRSDRAGQTDHDGRGDGDGRGDRNGRRDRDGRNNRDGAAAGSPDPILLEIFNRQFTHVAEQMGVILEQTAESVNIRERLDYSCALFDSGGSLIANAPHVPVHLGSMGDSVRAVLAAFPQAAAGDSFVLNAPYDGGTHLPDITVVTPLIAPGASTPAFVLASRAHHADIGGVTPGSMPARSRSIDDEGVVFAPMKIVAGGKFLEADVRARLTAGPHPARNPDQNIADLRAQLAANTRGIAELDRLIGRHGSQRVDAYTKFVQRNAENCVREALGTLEGGQCTVELDGGERIAVTVRVDRQARNATIDFSGTSAASPGNYNAPAAIARSVVLYVFRSLIRHDIPLNAGCLVPLEILLPPGSLVDPRPPAAVVAGNVETSQCIADALLAAVGAQAASQGTMNNFTFGDETHQYYETICGGCGAGPAFDGASAVHSHMTNSKLTDPEILEQRFPIRLQRFCVRTGSGGAGRRRGGDGVVREIEFLAPLTGSILSNRRRTVPFGLAGGHAGLPGRNTIVRADHKHVEVGATAEMRFRPGDRFIIETPGGGGYGRIDRNEDDES